jgi:hypothetical protein
MGAWGPGSFENDDALDLLGEISPETAAEALDQLFQRIVSAGMRGEEIDASDSARALAAAELISAARGHAPDDLPGNAAAIVKALGKPGDEHVENAASAISYVLMRSELVELWAEADDPAEWNEAVSGLIARLDAPARAKKLGKKKQDQMTGAVCSFCGEQIPARQFVSMDLRRPWTPAGMSCGIYAHEACLNAKLHPKHIVQWWTPPDV